MARCFALEFADSSHPSSDFGPFPDTLSLTPPFDVVDGKANGTAYAGLVPEPLIPRSFALAVPSPLRYAAVWDEGVDSLRLYTLGAPISVVTIEVKRERARYSGYWEATVDLGPTSRGGVVLRPIACRE